MSNIDGNQPVVDDNSLVAFEAEFYGKAKPANSEPEETEEVEEDADPEVEAVEPEPVESDDEGEEDEGEDEDEESDPEPEPKRKNRKTAKERIQELSAQKRQMAEQLDDLQRRLSELETPAKEKAKPATPVEDSDFPDPDAKDDEGNLIYPLGEYDKRYQADLVRSIVQKEREAARALDAEERVKQEQLQRHERLVGDWNDRLVESEKTLPDLRPKIAELEEVFVDADQDHIQYLAETIMEMDRGPEILYYLSENIGEAERIVASSPRAATIALGRIEGLMTSKALAKESNKKVSKAPSPPTSTRGTGAGKTIRPDTDNLEAFEKLFYDKK